jgi:3-oxoacyl-[acyl-carrier protein] reductase
MKKLQGKVAVVTGASKGIGAGIAKSLAAEGAAVVVNYASSKAGADAVVAEIVKAGGKAVAVHGDVAKTADIKKLFEATAKAFGIADIVVNNAGVFQFGPLEGVTEDEFHRQFNINVLGTIMTAQAAAAQFGPDGGNIINVSSVVGAGPVPNSVIYSATKGAINNITRGLALELAPRKIRVNAIAPGGTETEGTHTAGIIGSDFEKQMIGMTPLGRLGQPDDIARVVTFLASDDSSWITGEVLTASGGMR